MSSTDTRTVDPAMPHHSDNGGHEMSDFSWTTVLWLIPLSVIILVSFFYVCIVWFQGAKDSELAVKQGEFVTSELNALHAKESETLGSYKILDKDKGRYQIPIARAMELMAQENQGKTGKAWTPITDTYLQGAAFKADAAPAAQDNGIKVEESAAKDAKDAKGAKSTEAMKSGQHAEKRGH